MQASGRLTFAEMTLAEGVGDFAGTLEGRRLRLESEQRADSQFARSVLASRFRFNATLNQPRQLPTPPIVQRSLTRPGAFSASTAPQPVITSVAGVRGGAEGRPGDPIVVIGSGFTAWTKIFIVVNPGVVVEAPIDSRRENDFILCSVPYVTGVTEYSGVIFATTGILQSSPVPFRFKPLLDLRTYDCWDELAIANPICVGSRGLYTEWRAPGGGATSYSVLHRLSNSGVRYEADDIHFPGVRLPNGFVVDSMGVSYSKLPIPGDHRVSVTMDARTVIGSDMLEAKVHWSFARGLWTDRYDLTYRLGVIVKGPKDVSFGPSANGRLGVLNTLSPFS